MDGPGIKTGLVFSCIITRDKGAYLGGTLALYHGSVALGNDIFLDGRGMHGWIKFGNMEGNWKGNLLASPLKESCIISLSI